MYICICMCTVYHHTGTRDELNKLQNLFERGEWTPPFGTAKTDDAFPEREEVHSGTDGTVPQGIITLVTQLLPSLLRVQGMPYLCIAPTDKGQCKRRQGECSGRDQNKNIRYTNLLLHMYKKFIEV